MIEEPVPTMPDRVPATRPTARTKMKFKVGAPANRAMLARHREPSEARNPPRDRDGVVHMPQRHCLRQTQRVCARERKRRSNPVILPAARWIASVSYTHLTLPTI